MAVTYNGLWKILLCRNMSVVDLRKYTGIAPNTMTRIRKNERVSFDVLDRICNILECDYSDIMSYDNDNQTIDIPTFNINNRRYLGNKHKLIPFIKNVVTKHCRSISSVADIFSGTGVVASAFKNKRLITNDLMYSNYICNYAWFSGQCFDNDKLLKIISYFNSINSNEDNYMTENFADTYFSSKDCAKIGYIRESIEKMYLCGEVNKRERALLITSLIYAMDRIANTCGHYDAYIQGAGFSRHLVLCFPNASTVNNHLNCCYNEDANELVKRITSDIVYIDPPYNSRQYCDAYHLLENVALWKKPDVFGVARKMDRTSMKSRYCTKSAETAFAELIENINSKYILLSYNNMANKGNARSNAKISDNVIIETLRKKGKVQVFEERYKAFSAGKSDIQDNVERLFLCTCKK